MFISILSNSLFMALLASFCLSITVPIIGSFVLVQRKSGLVDSLAHISMLGAAIGLWLGVNAYVSAIVIAVVFVFGIFELGNKIVHKEAILALFTGFSLAFISLIKKISGIRINLESIFYGNLNLISAKDLGWIILVTIVFLALITSFYRQFLWISIDEDLAITQGVDLPRTRILFNTLAALTLAVFIQIFGIVIISLISIATVLIASNVVKGFKPKLVCSCIIAVISLCLSILTSYFWLDLSVNSILAVILFATIPLTYFSKPIRIKKNFEITN